MSLSKFAEGVFWACRAVKGDLTRADLTHADLTHANLTHANLRGADLTGANLTGANLTGANLTGAYLAGANLTGANLTRADLRAAYLYGANLRGADLYHADLCRAALCNADLSGANLCRADLEDANLTHADLNGANLTGANLTGANLTGATMPPLKCPSNGDIVGWKKVRGAVLKLLVTGKRTGSYVGAKCRTDCAKVLEAFPFDGYERDTKFVSLHTRNFPYHVGEVVLEPRYCDDPRVECAPGIHFFLTREEAEAFRMH